MSKPEYQLLNTLSFCSYGGGPYQGKTLHIYVISFTVLTICLFIADPQTKPKPPDVVHDTIGDFGRWQLKVSLLMALMKFPVAWFQLGIVFLAPPTEFWCAPPKELRNLSSEEWKCMSTPKNASLMHHVNILLYLRSQILFV